VVNPTDKNMINLRKNGQINENHNHQDKTAKKAKTESTNIALFETQKIYKSYLKASNQSKTHASMQACKHASMQACNMNNLTRKFCNRLQSSMTLDGNQELGALNRQIPNKLGLHI
jgi:hypothetical protein